ncbi:MAG: ATP-grasp domain-containing protein [Azospirillaceae bacterium]|nr:ATP-grasp domain-containing protein [Azospirillaceae bacterium]
MTAVIVDPYSTGRLLAPALRRRDHSVIAVQSRPDLSPTLTASFVPDDFVARFAFDGDLPALVARLQIFKPDFVLPGNESAVELADRLGAALGTRGNDPATTAMRRNKFAMIERITAAGLLSARQTVVADTGEATRWAARNGWPVVAKPLDSASSDHVYFCRDAESLAKAVAKIRATRNFCGQTNEQALIQTYLDGDEYVVNSVSRGGRHYICDVLRSAKRSLNDSPFVYDYYRLLRDDDAVVAPLAAYTVQVLDALGIAEGAGHAEIRITARGPTLVEIGARCMGPLGSTTAISQGTGRDQVALLVDAFDGGAQIEPLLGGRYRFQRDAMVLYLPILVSGRIRELPDLSGIRALPSVTGADLLPRIGDMVRPSLDLTQMLAKVYLSHADIAVFERDWQRIRSLEARLQPAVDPSPAA